MNILWLKIVILYFYFLNIILDNIKQNTRIDMSDGLDKDELLQGLTDLSRQQQQSNRF